jgi:hypothetical protein
MALVVDTALVIPLPAAVEVVEAAVASRVDTPQRLHPVSRRHLLPVIPQLQWLRSTLCQPINNTLITSIA